jgi:hypothetical protein
VPRVYIDAVNGELLLEGIEKDDNKTFKHGSGVLALVRSAHVIGHRLECSNRNIDGEV